MNSKVKTYFLVGKKANSIDETVIDSSVVMKDFEAAINDGLPGYTDLKLVKGETILNSLQISERYVPRSCLNTKQPEVTDA